jgi:2-keto-4-pentenoate hydratase
VRHDDDVVDPAGWRAAPPAREVEDVPADDRDADLTEPRILEWRRRQPVSILLVEKVDPRLQAALELQLASWRQALQAGATRVGWKLGMGDAERIGDEAALGHLTSSSVLPPGSAFVVGRSASLHADAELALQLGNDLPAGADDSAARAAIAGYGAALEIVDLGQRAEGADAVVAGNVFHRAVAFGPFHGRLPREGVEGRLLICGQVRAGARMAVDVTARVRIAARLLEAVGERLRAGDLLITGAVVQAAVARGDEVVADLGALGSVSATIR